MINENKSNDIKETIIKIVEAFSLEKSLFTTSDEDSPASESKLDINTIDEHIAINPKSDGDAILAINIVAINPITCVPPEFTKLQK